MGQVQNNYKSHINSQNNKKPDENKNKNKKKKDSNLTFNLFIIAILIYFAFTLYSQQMQLKELKKDYEDVNYEYSLKEKEIAKLKKELKNVDSKEFVEKQARENLKMVKPNETVYVDTNKSENLNDNLDINK